MMENFEMNEVLQLIHENLNKMLDGRDALTKDLKASDYDKLPYNVESLSNFMEIVAQQWEWPGGEIKQSATAAAAGQPSALTMLNEKIDFVIDAIVEFKKSREKGNAKPRRICAQNINYAEDFMDGNPIGIKSGFHHIALPVAPTNKSPNSHVKGVSMNEIPATTKPRRSRSQNINYSEEVPELNPIGSEFGFEHDLLPFIPATESKAKNGKKVSTIDARNGKRSKKMLNARKLKRGQHGRDSKDGSIQDEDGDNGEEMWTKSEADILKSIPLKVKQDFKKLGFTIYVGRYQPIVQLGPSDVACLDARKQWFDMYREKTSKHKPLHRLIYWYGTREEPCFSFIAANKLVSYESGVKRGLDKIPHDIKKKLDAKKSLNGTEKVIVDGLSDMQADAKLPPEERISWLSPAESSDVEIDSDAEVSSISFALDTEEQDDIVLDRAVSPSKSTNVSRKRSITNTCKNGENVNVRKSKRSHDNPLRMSQNMKGKKRTDVNQSEDGEKNEDEDPPSFDFRVTLKPKTCTKRSNEGETATLYDLKVCKDTEILMEEEIEIEKTADAKSQRKIHYENVHLNLTFNLEM